MEKNWFLLWLGSGAGVKSVKKGFKDLKIVVRIKEKVVAKNNCKKQQIKKQQNPNSKIITYNAYNRQSRMAK